MNQYQELQDKYDNQFMKKYLENNPKEVNKDIIIYHFPGSPGEYNSKLSKMIAFWVKINNVTMNNLLEDNPMALLENDTIGAFGEVKRKLL